MPAKRRQIAKSKLIVRPAGVRDLDALVHQRRAMWKALGIRNDELHERGNRVYRRWARARLRNHQLIAWVVKSDDGRTAGGGCLWLQEVQPRPHGPTGCRVDGCEGGDRVVPEEQVRAVDAACQRDGSKSLQPARFQAYLGDEA